MSVWLTYIPLLTSLPFPTATWYSQPLEYRSCCFSPPKVKVPRIHRASNFCTAASGKPVIACVFVCTRKSFIFPIIPVHAVWIFLRAQRADGLSQPVDSIQGGIRPVIWAHADNVQFPNTVAALNLPWEAEASQAMWSFLSNKRGCRPYWSMIDPCWSVLMVVGYNSNSTKQRTNIFTKRNHRVGWPFCTQPGIHGQFPTGGEQESFSDITASHCLLIWRRSASKCLRVRDLWCFLSALCPTCTWAVWTWRGKSMFSFHDWLHLMVFSSRGVCLVNTTWTLESIATTTHLPAITSSTACCILGSRELDVLWGTAIQTLEYWWPTCSSLRCGLCSTQ